MFVLPDDIQFNENLSITLRNFLRALAHHCGDKRTCWPSQARIAAFMGRSVRTVRRCERIAAELRLVEVKRRWLKSNVYTVLCLEDRQNSTMGTQERPVEQTTSLSKQRLTGRVVGSWKNPREVKILVEDMAEVLGEAVATKNRGWLWRIAQAVEDSWVYETLSWLKECMRDGEVERPCALFTWKLRVLGAQI